MTEFDHFIPVITKMTQAYHIYEKKLVFTTNKVIIKNPTIYLTNIYFYYLREFGFFTILPDYLFTAYIAIIKFIHFYQILILK